jgi:hypothetical protein
MAKIYAIEPIVAEALQNVPATRGDNYILYIEVLRKFIDPRMSLQSVFENHKTLGIPSLETITRCRRKLQEKHPELRDAAADKVRRADEQEFVEYSRK